MCVCGGGGGGVEGGGASLGEVFTSPGRARVKSGKDVHSSFVPRRGNCNTVLFDRARAEIVTWDTLLELFF